MKKIFLKHYFFAYLVFFSSVGIASESVNGACHIEVKTIPVGVGSIEYLSVGKGAPILLLHGLFAQKEQWSDLACQLSKAGHLVIAPDLPGYGKSLNFPIVDYKLENQVTILHRFSSLLQIPRMDIAGSSMGGAIASMYAQTYPSQIRTLAFIGAPLGVSGWSTQIKNAIYQGVNPFIPISADQLNLEMQLLFFKPPVLSEINKQELISNYQKFNRHYQQVWDIVNLYLYQIDKNPQSLLPTLIIWGREDGVFDVMDMPRLQHKYPNNQSTIINDASHLLMLEKSKEVTSLYLHFLKSGQLN